MNIVGDIVHVTKSQEYLSSNETSENREVDDDETVKQAHKIPKWN